MKPQTIELTNSELCSINGGGFGEGLAETVLGAAGWIAGEVLIGGTAGILIGAGVGYAIGYGLWAGQEVPLKNDDAWLAAATAMGD